MKKGQIITQPFCSVEWCKKKHYAKGFCRNHYAMFSLQGRISPQIKKCLAPGCPLNTKTQYCFFHKKRIKAGLPLTATRQELLFSHIGGKKHFRWNGGVQQYDQYRLFRKNRIIKMQEVKGKCEICGNRADEVHHIDNKKINHDVSNLQSLCTPCHKIIHRGRKNRTTTSIFIREYGMTLGDMADRFGYSIPFWRSRHIKGKLKNDLKELCR